VPDVTIPFPRRVVRFRIRNSCAPIPVCETFSSPCNQSRLSSALNTLITVTISITGGGPGGGKGNSSLGKSQGTMVSVGPPAKVSAYSPDASDARRAALKLRFLSDFILAPCGVAGDSLVSSRRSTLTVGMEAWTRKFQSGFGTS
jgi:hypothetical protein